MWFNWLFFLFSSWILVPFTFWWLSVCLVVMLSLNFNLNRTNTTEQKVTNFNLWKLSLFFFLELIALFTMTKKNTRCVYRLIKKYFKICNRHTLVKIHFKNRFEFVFWQWLWFLYSFFRFFSLLLLVESLDLLLHAIHSLLST